MPSGACSINGPSSSHTAAKKFESAQDWWDNIREKFDAMYAFCQGVCIMVEQEITELTVQWTGISSRQALMELTKNLRNQS